MPLPMPTAASTQTSDRSLASDGFWKPSSMMMRSTPCSRRSCAPGHPVAADHGRRRRGEEQRLVADVGRVVASRDRRGAAPWPRRHSRGSGSPASGRGRGRSARARARSASCRRRRRRNCRRRPPAPAVGSGAPGPSARPRDRPQSCRHRPQHHRGGAPLGPPPEARAPAQGSIAAARGRPADVIGRDRARAPSRSRPARR